MRFIHAIIRSMQGWSSEVRKTLISGKQIQKRVTELGAKITGDYWGRSPLFVAVLRGAAIFCADLIRHVDLKLSVDFIGVASYGPETESSGQVQLIKDVDSSIRGLDVVLVEGIIDTGLTVNYLMRTLQSRDPASLRICTLLSRTSRRKVEIPVDYVGFEISDEFVIGYGLDYDQKYRNLNCVSVLPDKAPPPKK